MRPPLVLAVSVLAVFALPDLAAGQGASGSLGPPGIYGRLDLGDYPPPLVIYARPKSIEPVALDRPPIYLHVPPDHARNWRRNCRRYDACGERVYFVQETWYNREYANRLRNRRGDPPQEQHGPREQANQGPMGGDHSGPDHGPGNDHRPGR